MVPDQHAAFGITRATQAKRESAWKDLGLEELIRKGPEEASGTNMGMGGYGSGWKGTRAGSGGLPR